MVFGPVSALHLRVDGVGWHRYGGVKLEDAGAKIFTMVLVLFSIPIFVRALQVVGHEVRQRSDA